MNVQSIGGDKQLPRLDFIDGLRGIAVLMVVLSHASQGFTGGNFHFSAVSHFVKAGDRGVQLFFILSAFTLFMTSLKRYKTDNKPLVSFYIRRFFRIAPFWWLIIAFWAGLYAISPGIILMSVTFIFGFFRFINGVEFVPGGWTLFIEETFYIFLPLIRKYINSIYYALSLFLFLLIVRFTWLYIGSNFDILHNNNFLVFAPPAQWFAFALGIIFFFIHQNNLFIKTISRKDINTLLTMVTICIILLFLGEDMVLSSLALLMVCLSSINPSSFFGKISRYKALKDFGKRCYSIYLLQFIVLLQLNPIMNNFFKRNGLGEKSHEFKLLIYFPVVCIVLYIVSLITFKFVEKPSISYGRRLINKINNESTA